VSCYCICRRVRAWEGADVQSSGLEIEGWLCSVLLSHVSCVLCSVADVLLAGIRVEYTCMLVVQCEESVGGEEHVCSLCNARSLLEVRSRLLVCLSQLSLFKAPPEGRVGWL
jgi:hypothetical protein